MSRTRRDADRNTTDVERANPMDRRNPNARVLGDHAFEHTVHFFLSEGFMGFVVEPGNLFPVGVVTDDPMENTNAARSRVLDRFANFIEQDFLVDDPTRNARRSTGHGRQYIDTIAIVKRLPRVDKITVHRQSHAP